MRSEESFVANSHIKSVVQPKYVEAAKGSHCFLYKDDKFCVNENRVKIEGSFSPNSVSKIQLNHYYCRSLEEYEAKIKRGYGDTSKKRKIDEFYTHDSEANNVKDTTITDLLNLIK
jgi:hypothetical protein